MRTIPLALLLVGLTTPAQAGDAPPAPDAEALASLKAAMGGPAIDAVTRFDYRLTTHDRAGKIVGDARGALLPGAQALQMDDLISGDRIWSGPQGTWRLRAGQWETQGDVFADSYRTYAATHLLSLLRDPRTGVARTGAQRLRITPAGASAFEATLDSNGRILEDASLGLTALNSDYRQVDGLWWPMSFRFMLEGSHVRTGRYSEVAVHTTPDPALPALPPLATVPRMLPTAGFDVARLVGAGWLSGAANDYNLTTDAASTRLVFARSQPEFKDAHIWTARRDGEHWQEPQPVPFTDRRYSDSDPWLTPDGRTLYFISNRPLQGEAPRKDLELWRVAVHADGFGTPEHLAMLGSDGQELGPELHDGWLYFNSTRPGGPARMSIWRARMQGGGFGAPEPLGAPFNDGAVQGDFTLAPDGDTALFWSVRGDSRDPDLFAARRTPQGWSPAVRLPAPINAPGMDFTPSFSADGQQLSFASERKPGRLSDPAHAFNGQANVWVAPAAVVEAALRDLEASP